MMHFTSNLFTPVSLLALVGFASLLATALPIVPLAVDVYAVRQHPFTSPNLFQPKNARKPLSANTTNSAYGTTIDASTRIAAEIPPNAQVINTTASSLPNVDESRQTYVNGWSLDCPAGFTPCATADGQSWECIDTETSLTQCGGCSIPLDTNAVAGRDCIRSSGLNATIIEHNPAAAAAMAAITCVAGMCTHLW